MANKTEALQLTCCVAGTTTDMYREQHRDDNSPLKILRTGLHINNFNDNIKRIIDYLEHVRQYTYVKQMLSLNEAIIAAVKHILPIKDFNDTLDLNDACHELLQQFHGCTAAVPVYHVNVVVLDAESVVKRLEARLSKIASPEAFDCASSCVYMGECSSRMDDDDEVVPLQNPAAYGAYIEGMFTSEIAEGVVQPLVFKAMKTCMLQTDQTHRHAYYRLYSVDFADKQCHIDASLVICLPINDDNHIHNTIKVTVKGFYNVLMDLNKNHISDYIRDIVRTNCMHHLGGGVGEDLSVVKIKILSARPPDDSRSDKMMLTDAQAILTLPTNRSVQMQYIRYPTSSDVSVSETKPNITTEIIHNVPRPMFNETSRPQPQPQPQTIRQQAPASTPEQIDKRPRHSNDGGDNDTQDDSMGDEHVEYVEACAISPGPDDDHDDDHVMVSEPDDDDVIDSATNALLVSHDWLTYIETVKSQYHNEMILALDFSNDTSDTSALARCQEIISTLSPYIHDVNVQQFMVALCNSLCSVSTTEAAAIDQPTLMASLLYAFKYHYTEKATMDACTVMMIAAIRRWNVADQEILMVELAHICDVVKGPEKSKHKHAFKSIFDTIWEWLSSSNSSFVRRTLTMMKPLLTAKDCRDSFVDRLSDLRDFVHALSVHDDDDDFHSEISPILTLLIKIIQPLMAYSCYVKRIVSAPVMIDVMHMCKENMTNDMVDIINNIGNLAHKNADLVTACTDCLTTSTSPKAKGRAATKRQLPPDEEPIELLHRPSDVIKRMTGHLDDIQLLRDGCTTLCGMSHDDDGCKKIVRAGGVKCVVSVMTKHIDDVVIQKYGCNVLYNIAFNKGCSGEVVDAGGTGAILSALSKRIRDSTVNAVPRYAVEALRMVATRGHISEILRGHGVRHMIDAMSHHPNDLMLQRDACVALYECLCHISDGDWSAANDVIQHAVGPQLVVKAMATYYYDVTNDCELVRCALGVLAIACRDRDNVKEMIVNAGVIRHALDTMDRHIAYHGVQNNACRLLHNLCVGTNRVTYANQIADRDGVKYILNAMVTHADIHHLNAIGIRTLGALCDLCTVTSKTDGVIASHKHATGHTGQSIINAVAIGHLDQEIRQISRGLIDDFLSENSSDLDSQDR